jgi:beta-glucanase (GH16 family)
MRTPGILSSAQRVILFDDFPGTSVDTTKWVVYDRVSDQVNGEGNCCVPANVRVSGSMLLIDAKHEDHTCVDCLPSRTSPGGTPAIEGPRLMNYTSGHVQQVAPSFLYGTVSVRAKIPGGEGVWPCIWMLGDSWKASQPCTANTPAGYDGWPTGNWWEIDIAEWMSNVWDSMNCTCHYQVPGGFVTTLPYNATTRFMVYRLVWRPGSAKFFVDPEDGTGFQLVHEEAGAVDVVPNTPGYFTINMPVGGKAGPINPATFPLTMQIDWVRITQP